MSKNLRIVFMGTPDFSVPTLKALLGSRHEVVGVITSVDKPAGRGRKIRYSGVKSYYMEAGLEEQGVHLMQPPNLKNPQFQEELKALRADLQVVVAFRMLPEAVWNMPALGTLNLHASLLPKYRGAAPINWAIMNGETETGLTTFLLQHAIDTGNLLDQVKLPIAPNDTAGDLHDRMMEAGGDLVVKTVDSIADSEHQPLPQDLESDFPKAPKLNSENTAINWDQPAETIRNFIRGLSPYPAAWTKLHDKKLKVFSASHPEDADAPEMQVGAFYFDSQRLLVQAADGPLQIDELQLEGKRRMKTEDFLRGYQFPKTSA